MKIHEKRKDRRAGSRRKRALTAAAVAGVFLVALLGTFFFVRPFGTPKVQAEDELANLHTNSPNLTTFLLIGADSRPDDPGRSDTLIVGAYDKKQQRLAMLSIPRDTYTYINKEHGYDKINHAFAYGQQQLTVSVVQRLIGMPIDHYVVVNFQGFIQIIDALGGIDIDAEKRMYYVDPADKGMGPNGLVIDIQPGPQHMDGKTALGYARFRHDEEADRGRMRRQQQVIKTVVAEIAQPSTFIKIPKLVPALFNTVKTDMTPAEILAMGLGAKGAMEKGVVSATLDGEGMTLNGIYYMVPNLVDVRKTAYETLVGGEAPPEFMAKAQEDQTAFARVVQREKARTVQNAGTPSTPSSPTTVPSGSGSKGNTGGASTPGGGKSTPSDGLSTPSDGLGTPSDGLGTPSDGLGTPGGGTGTPSDGLGTPGGGLGTSGGNAGTSGGGSSTSGGGSSTSGGGSSTSGGGSSTSGGGAGTSGGGAGTSGGGAGTSGGGTGTPGDGTGTPGGKTGGLGTRIISANGQ
jgi:LCP family protein required for cell wall assembly